MDWMLHAQALLGIVVFVALALPFSRAPRDISWKLVGSAILLQFAICFVLLKVPVISAGFAYLTRAVNALSAATLKGTSFIFGYLGGGATPFEVTNPNAVVTFAFQVLPLVIIMTALSALLWYWRVLPIVIRAISRVFEKTLGTRGPAGLVATANIFVGQVEAPLLVRPYIREVESERDQRRQIQMFAGRIGIILSRVAPMFEVMRGAAKAEPEIRALLDKYLNGRMQGMGYFIDCLLANGELRRNVSKPAAPIATSLMPPS